MSPRGFGPLVDGAWLEAHLDDPDLVILEVDEQPLIYGTGHVPGAFNVDWHRDLQDPVSRDVPGPDALRETWGRYGVTKSSRVVLYGDKNNWYACFGYWLFQHYGLERMALLDGGRQLWLAEGRPTTRERPDEGQTGRRTPAPTPTGNVRGRWSDVLRDDALLLDVRTPAEYSGDLLTEPGYPQEVAQRPGHIPGAENLPWDVATSPDGRFLEADELEALFAAAGATSDRPVITYCRIGERSAHTWFVLHELLGRRHVRNYDGSWTEWGSMIGMPVALGPQAGRMPSVQHAA